jgi:hypothetical protein
VPDNVMGHDGSPVTDAAACAVQVTVDPDNTPFAVPEIRKSPAQVALKVPLAVLPVCCVTFHLKSVHVLAPGITFADVQFPSSALTPVAEGLSVLLRS